MRGLRGPSCPKRIGMELVQVSPPGEISDRLGLFVLPKYQLPIPRKLFLMSQIKRGGNGWDPVPVHAKREEEGLGTGKRGEKGERKSKEEKQCFATCQYLTCNARHCSFASSRLHVLVSQLPHASDPIRFRLGNHRQLKHMNIPFMQCHAMVWHIMQIMPAYVHH